MNLLNKALTIFRQNWMENFEDNYQAMEDGQGKFAYSFSQYILVAKRYAWQGTVSVHEEVWNRCLEENKKLVMFLESPGGLFLFDISEIKNNYENLRNGIRMMNFNMKYGAKIGEDNGFIANSNAVRLSPESDIFVNTGIV